MQDITNFLINQIGQNGIFFALFLYLFYTSSKDGKDREARLIDELNKSQSMLEEFAKKYDLLDQVAQKINNIEAKLSGQSVPSTTTVPQEKTGA